MDGKLARDRTARLLVGEHAFLLVMQVLPHTKEQPANSTRLRKSMEESGKKIIGYCIRFYSTTKAKMEIHKWAGSKLPVFLNV